MSALAPTLAATPADARALCLAAQQQADRFNRPATPWQPRPGALRRPVRRGLVLALLAAVGTAAVLGLSHLPAKPITVPAVAPKSALSDLPAASQAALAVVAMAVAVASAPSAPSAMGGIEAERGDIRIELMAMPLLEAVRLLASATHATLVGAETLRNSTRRVTLKWHGSSATAAWQQVLADDANYAARCDAGTCQVWVLGASAPQLAASIASLSTTAASAAATATVATVATVSWPATAAASMTLAEPAPLLAHSAPQPAAAAPQPDPPGLFPSDG